MDERMPDAADGLMVFSPSSRAILYVNAPAVELLGMGEDELLVHDADEILPELADITPRSFTAQRPGGRVLAVRLEPLRTGPFMRTNAMAAILAPERSATAASAEPAVNGSEVARLQSLWTLAMSADNQDDEYAATVVCEGARALGLQWGMIEHAGDDGPVVDVAGAADGDGVP
ncbi:MAG: hypothetical protein ACREM6_01350, partial [Vulcanimicrobiaceae bacterium]